ncbi:MAG: hypothetical protein ABI142_06600 [Bryocella sp.]
MPGALPLRQQTLRLYGEIVARLDDAAGKMIFAAGVGVAGIGLAEAASVAGTTSLLLEPDMQSARRALRRGGIDFLVNTLDEALRVLKNEIRQRRPLGVVLMGEVATVLAEMKERGVLPDLRVDIDAGEDADREGLIVPAVQEVRLAFVEGELLPSEEATRWLEESGWQESVVAAMWRPSAADVVRTRWAERIERYQRLPRAEMRYGWISDAEGISLSAQS